MKSLRVRLAVWFAAGLVLVLAVFVFFSHRLLDAELHDKNWREDYPDHPDWKLHGSYSEAEVKDVLAEFTGTSLAYGIPLALAALVIGYWLAQKSIKPIARLNNQLAAIRAPDLSRRIELPEMDAEFRDLVRHINELLSRLERSFKDMGDYAARVAHELRTPLAIMRLKVEQAGARISPELGEELQSELHQLAHIVDQSLLIAKAEQGRLVLRPVVFDLSTLVQDVAVDFALLAQNEDRVLDLQPPPPASVVADFKYTKQIIHSLLSNALKHGQGAIRVRIRNTGDTVVLAVANRCRLHPAEQAESLGFGLRVVDTLLRLQPELKFSRRVSRGSYGARLEFHRAIASKAGGPPAVASAHDPHI